MSRYASYKANRDLRAGPPLRSPHSTAGSGLYCAVAVLTLAPLSRYKTPGRALEFYQSIQREIGSLSAVRAVGLGFRLPMDGWEIGQSFWVAGTPPVPVSQQRAAHYQIVNARYFEALGIPMVRGRAFTEHDDSAAAPVCIVNEELARKYMKGMEPIGAHISVEAMTMKGPTPVMREVVGVVHHRTRRQGTCSDRHSHYG